MTNEERLEALGCEYQLLTLDTHPPTPNNWLSCPSWIMPDGTRWTPHSQWSEVPKALSLDFLFDYVREHMPGWGLYWESPPNDTSCYAKMWKVDMVTPVGAEADTPAEAAFDAIVQARKADQ